MALVDSTYTPRSDQPGQLRKLQNWLSKLVGLTTRRNVQAELLLEAGHILGDNFESPNHKDRFAKHLARLVDFDYFSLAHVDHSEWTVENLIHCGTRISGISESWSMSIDAAPQPEVFATKLAAMCEVEQGRPRWPVSSLVDV
jgi:hypothetical protein